jgi:hypothetical protein
MPARGIHVPSWVSIAKPGERVQDRVIAHRLLLVLGSGEHKSAIACEQFERPQYFLCLAGQGNDMRRLHLHALGGNSPTCVARIAVSVSAIRHLHARCGSYPTFRVPLGACRT